jgi:hypothetical protein
LSDDVAADLQLPRVIAALVGSDIPAARVAAREAFARDVHMGSALSSLPACSRIDFGD